MTEALLELMRFRQLMWSLTWRDLRVRYKQSAMGVAWAMLLPLALMLVFTFVFTRAIDSSAILRDVDMPYALFAYTGLVPWTFFASSLNACTNSLVANRNLVTKVYFPREVFPLSCVAGSFVDFCVALVVLAGLMVYFHLTGQYAIKVAPSLFFIPVVVAVQIVLTVGLGMGLAMANLFYRDVRQILSVTIQLWMFVSAVVVPIPQDGSFLASILAFNPLVGVIGAYRDCIIHGTLPAAPAFGYAAAVSVVVLIGGWIGFRRASSRFAEYV